MNILIYVCLRVALPFTELDLVFSLARNIWWIFFLAHNMKTGFSCCYGDVWYLSIKLQSVIMYIRKWGLHYNNSQTLCSCKIAMWVLGGFSLCLTLILVPGKSQEKATQQKLPCTGIKEHRRTPQDKWHAHRHVWACVRCCLHLFCQDWALSLAYSLCHHSMPVMNFRWCHLVEVGIVEGKPSLPIRKHYPSIMLMVLEFPWKCLLLQFDVPNITLEKLSLNHMQKGTWEQYFQLS